ncbi:MAG: hypothetical protein ACLGH8_12260 [Bacteroidia bacterium]
MKTKILLLLVLMPLLALGQKKPREILRGHIVADSLHVGDVTVKNSTSHINAVTDENGYFTLYARAGDTLRFSSITYRYEDLVLTDALMHENPLTLRMDINVNMLDEVVITPLTGDLGYDAKHTKVRALNPKLTSEDLKYPYAIAREYPTVSQFNNESTMQGIDFIAVYRLFKKKKKAKEDRGEIYREKNAKTFTDVVKGRFTHFFFTESLHIPHDEIGSFLAFCDKGDETRPLLDPRKEFELTDYLVAKAPEYLERKKG